MSERRRRAVRVAFDLGVALATLVVWPFRIYDAGWRRFSGLARRCRRRFERPYGR
jgi:hypothetical protein